MEGGPPSSSLWRVDLPQLMGGGQEEEEEEEVL